MAAGVVGLVIVLASSSVSKHGVKLGPKSAEACTKNGPECLPRIGYADTTDTLWTNEALADKVVMVNFWATWCAPCKSEVPALTSVYQKYKDRGFVLLGVVTDNPTDPQLAEFSRRYNLGYPVVPADQIIFEAFGWPDALPTTFIYDRSGTLRLRHRGAISSAALDKAIAELIDGDQ